MCELNALALKNREKTTTTTTAYSPSGCSCVCVCRSQSLSTVFFHATFYYCCDYYFCRRCCCCCCYCSRAAYFCFSCLVYWCRAGFLRFNVCFVHSIDIYTDIISLCIYKIHFPSFHSGFLCSCCSLCRNLFHFLKLNIHKMRVCDSMSRSSAPAVCCLASPAHRVHRIFHIIYKILYVYMSGLCVICFFSLVYFSAAAASFRWIWPRTKTHRAHVPCIICR